MNTISNNMEKRMGGIQKIVRRLENRNNNTNGMECEDEDQQNQEYDSDLEVNTQQTGLGHSDYNDAMNKSK
jgi:hypothetical protein